MRATNSHFYNYRSTSPTSVSESGNLNHWKQPTINDMRNESKRRLDKYKKLEPQDHITKQRITRLERRLENLTKIDMFIKTNQSWKIDKIIGWYNQPWLKNKNVISEYDTLHLTNGNDQIEIKLDSSIMCQKWHLLDPNNHPSTELKNQIDLNQKCKWLSHEGIVRFNNSILSLLFIFWLLRIKEFLNLSPATLLLIFKPIKFLSILFG